MTAPPLDGLAVRPDAGKIIASVLETCPLPATRVLEHLANCDLRLQVLASGGRNLTRPEAHRLRAGAILRCRYRHGLLTTADGMPAASTSLVWLPARLRHDTCRELDEGARPAGHILGGLGMTRADRRAMPTRLLDEATGQQRVSASSAVLVVGGLRVAIAEEFVLAPFAATLT